MFTLEKILESIIFVSKKTNDIYKILKIIYFADLIHLAKNGRLITEDSYIAMDNGPVPSTAYDFIKIARGSSFLSFPNNNEILNSLKIVDDRTIKSTRDCNLDFLSQSEIEALEQSIKENINLSFGELKKKSHDEAYNKTTKNKYANSIIDMEDIIVMLNNPDLLDYYKNFHGKQ